MRAHQQPRDVAASVRQRLLNLARQRGEEFQHVLNRYGVERLLYRLSQSPHHDRFVLKGATLFSLWMDQPHRRTRDLDLLGKGEADPPHLQELFRDLCLMPVEPDGLTFVSESVSAEAIREAERYRGVRIKLLAVLGGARVPLQVDVGFGDVVTPAPPEAALPGLLDFPAPRLRVYPRETVVAEKLQVIVALGLLNSRMKDFYDLWVLSRELDFHGPTLCRAVQATFSRRQTLAPIEAPVGLSASFYEDEQKQRQWEGFLQKGTLGPGVTLEALIQRLREFLLPPLEAVAQGRPFDQAWHPDGPWRPSAGTAPETPDT